jgi:hypothetical protein
MLALAGILIAKPVWCHRLAPDGSQRFSDKWALPGDHNEIGQNRFHDDHH